MSPPRAVICPYCGEAQTLSERCRACAGFFEPLSRQATHNAMGAWFIRDPAQPFRPGCSYETLVALIARGRVIKTTVLRGPTTGQFWTIARRVQGVSHLFGYCHHCDGAAEPADHGCEICGVSFMPPAQRNSLGLPPIRPLDGSGEPVAAATVVEAPAGGAISSFAADAVVTTEHPAGWEASEQGGFSARPSDTDLELSMAVGNLQRRMRGQRKVIRVLAAGFILALGGLGYVVYRFAVNPDGHALAKSNSSGPATPAMTQPATSKPAESATAATSPATAPTTSPDAAASPVLDEVQGLIEAAEKRERSIEERRMDYEKAKSMLEGFLTAPPEGADALEIRLLLERATKGLERLSLTDFFPEM